MSVAATDLPPLNAESYLGDGLYVSFDGEHIRLRAPREGGDHWVAMEPEVFQALLRWMHRSPALWKYFADAAE